MNSAQLEALSLEEAPSLEEMEACSFRHFCELHDFSVQLGYRLLAQGKVRTFKAGRKRLVSREARAEFRRLLEAETEG